jgi:hypothetical protein
VRLDRTKAGAAAFISAQFPRRLYLAEYSGRVVAQGGPNSFDFQPDDTRIPGVSGIPLRLPAPGITITVNPAEQPRALLAFADGDPAKPELRLWESPGLAQLVIQAATLISLEAAQLKLGAAATEAVLKGTSYKAAFDAWRGALDTYLAAIATAVNGLTVGALIPSTATYVASEATFATSMATVLSTKVKTE